jgi:hypothetical protein
MTQPASKKPSTTKSVPGYTQISISLPTDLLAEVNGKNDAGTQRLCGQRGLLAPR